MDHHKVLLVAGVSLSMVTIATHTLAENLAATPHTLAMPAQVTPTEPSLQLPNLVQPLIHYPDHMVRTAFAASTNPEQIALAARYLSEPNSIEGKPDFDQPILALMQYPNLLAHMAADLVWVSELGQIVSTHEQEALWSALNDGRFAQPATGQPINVVQTHRVVTHRSRPVHRSSTHWIDRPFKQYRAGPNFTSQPLRHQTWWHDSIYGHQPRGYVRHHRPRIDRQHWWLGASYGHQSRHYRHHRGLHDNWLFHHQQRLKRPIQRQPRAHSHNEHRRAHKRDHRRADRWEHQRKHRQQYRPRHEHRQDRRHSEHKRHSSHLRSNSPMPRKDPPRAWMSPQGSLK